MRCVLLAACLAAVPIASNGALIISHAGSSDPTTEGWTAEIGAGGGVAVGGLNDGGTPAWFVDDNSTGLGSTYLYTSTVGAPDIALGNSSGWILSASLRVASDEALGSTGSPVVLYRDGVTSWQMNFGLNGSGDTIVQLVTGILPSVGPTHTISGNSTYNSFSLIFDPVGSTADLFVNGTEVISNYAGFANTQTRVFWGAGVSADSGQGNFSSVAFSVAPEPGAGALLLLGLGGLLTYRRRGRGSSR